MVPVIERLTRRSLPSHVFVGCTALLVCHCSSSIFQELLELVRQVVPYHMRHNAEPEAVDILLEVERLDWLAEHVDDKNYSRSAAAAVLCGGYQQRPPATPGRVCVRPMIREYCRSVSCFALPASTCI